jgi:DNA replication licensing factor MCM4
VLDKPNPVSDRMLAKHLVSLYFVTSTVKPAAIDPKTMRDYIAYATAHVHPTISDDAQKDLIEGYLDMRRMGGNKKTITATPRQLESLIR